MVAYALATASEADDRRDRELGPIHLLKYTYLGDLAFAESNGGKPYSGVRWRFHKFGPWSLELYEYLPQAIQVSGAATRHLQSAYKEDAVRWSLPRPARVVDIQSRLPASVSAAIGNDVKHYYNDTYSLLHYVYRTAPMLCAAPGEDLAFKAREQSPPAASDATGEVKTLSKTQIKKIKEEFRSLLAARKTHSKPVAPQVSYDAEYFQILDLLDREVGDTLEESEGTLEFSPEVWKSEARRGSDIP
jgi:hypothetical protein